ncbi:MAG: peptide-methionine (S)-S-oxide reductase MsrA [Thermoanaerobaculia bacterium]
MPSDTARFEKATLAGGCYWCMEPAFDCLPGVIHVRAGYAGEATERREAVEILFDPATIGYTALLEVFWSSIDPLDDRGQFCDVGSEYTSAIYPHGETQRKLAEESKREIEARRRGGVVTAIVTTDRFEPAAEYDQNYYRKHPVRYAFYRLNCGRDARLADIWGAR